MRISVSLLVICSMGQTVCACFFLFFFPFFLCFAAFLTWICLILCSSMGILSWHKPAELLKEAVSIPQFLLDTSWTLLLAWCSYNHGWTHCRTSHKSSKIRFLQGQFHDLVHGTAAWRGMNSQGWEMGEGGFSSRWWSHRVTLSCWFLALSWWE